MHDFLELLSHYKGKISTDNDRISFSNVNTLRWHDKDRKVLCSIDIYMSFLAEPDRYRVQMEEKTYEILGGSSSGSLTKDEALEKVKKGLERYCFPKKDMEQLGLF